MSSPHEPDRSAYDTARLVDVVRRVSGDAPDAATIDAIAAGAWERAHQPQRQSHHRAPRNLHFLRPLGLAAAALLIAAVGVHSFTPDTALAVDGDPVEVWDGDGWTSESRVRPGDWVYAPTGARSVRFGNGSALQPEPGSMFRVERLESPAGSGLPFRVEVRRGAVAYDGDPLALTLSEVDVTPKSQDGFLSVSVSSSEGTPTAPTSPDALLELLESLPRIAVSSGTVVVRARKTGESLTLGRSEAATLFASSGPSGLRRLTRLRTWSGNVPTDVLNGNLVVDATPSSDGGVRVLIGGGSQFSTVEIPAAQRAGAIQALNVMMEICGQFLSDLEMKVDLHATGPVRWTGGGRAHRIGTVIKMKEILSGDRYEEMQLTLERDGVTTRLMVSPDGACALITEGNIQVYSGPESFRKKHPELAEELLPHVRKVQ